MIESITCICKFCGKKTYVPMEPVEGHARHLVDKESFRCIHCTGTNTVMFKTLHQKVMLDNAILMATLAMRAVMNSNGDLNKHSEHLMGPMEAFTKSFDRHLIEKAVTAFVLERSNIPNGEMLYQKLKTIDFATLDTKAVLMQNSAKMIDVAKTIAAVMKHVYDEDIATEGWPCVFLETGIPIT